MKAHLKQIPPEGLHLEGDEECPISDVQAEDMRCVGPMSYNIEIGVSDGALWATGSLKQSVELRCVACLRNFVHQIRVSAFAIRTELHGPETIDLTPFVREELLLNLPPHPRCDRDGSAVCQAAQPQPAPSEVKRKADWSALDKLKL
jgi:uncharacterized protein